MPNGIYRVPPPVNEPVKAYGPGSPERRELSDAVAALASEPLEHRRVVARAHQAGPREMAAAIKAAREAWQTWSRMPWEARFAIFLKAADLLAGPRRMAANAATMVGQSKTAHQAEIDSAAELIDFWRFNPHFAQTIYADQPISSPGTWNQLEYRALEGFVLAITPFNFTSIAGNLPTAPAMMGDTVIWKPASTAIASSWVIFKILEEAGLPPGVINFVPGPGSLVGPMAIASPDLAGVHFTGSTGVFHSIWEGVAANIRRYRNYPRLVGETGGKDFVFVHASADPTAVVTALVRGAFEYQGQKCSAASRAYVPQSLWPKVRRALVEQLREVRVGDPCVYTHFMGAVIDKASYQNLTGAIASAKRSAACSIVFGGEYDAREGWFI
nr:aldehyde dehydrogenase family protein [Acidobacteriota bacterium]